ncbi:MAG: DUF4956 domain-containing protein [Bacteroidales bacterium]|nr:DUF4956 domain-containing protein [Bacteroidales bacterium]
MYYQRQVLPFFFNLLINFIIIRFVYYPNAKRSEYVFTYILISTIVFLLSFLLQSVDIQLGFALGLFAIFGIIRYRTTTVRIKEMTYLFMVIGISIINALVNGMIQPLHLGLINLFIILIAAGSEYFWRRNTYAVKDVIYEKINNIKPENQELLIEDLRERTGLDIVRVEIGAIDFLKDVAQLKVFYRAENPNIDYFQDT